MNTKWNDSVFCIQFGGIPREHWEMADEGLYGEATRMQEKWGFELISTGNGQCKEEDERSHFAYGKEIHIGGENVVMEVWRKD